MKLDRQKYELARARACMGQKDLVAAGIPKGTLPWISSRRSSRLSGDTKMILEKCKEWKICTISRQNTAKNSE